MLNFNRDKVETLTLVLVAVFLYPLIVTLGNIVTFEVISLISRLI